MAQSAEDASADEVDLQYFCHVCDDTVDDIEYADDGSIKCNVCNGTYVEILDPEEDDDAPQDTSPNQPQSNAIPNHNNNANQQNQNQNQNWNNANGQFLYFRSSNINNGQPIQMNMNVNGNPIPNIGQIIHQSMQMMQPMANPPLNNQPMNNQPMNNLFNFGGAFGGFNNMMQQMVDSDHGPPPTANTTIHDLPEYAYNGPTPVEEDDTDEEDTDEGDMQDVMEENDKKEENHTCAAQQDVDAKEDETDEKNRECAICKDQFGRGDMLKELPCAHRFHKDCIMPWLTRRNTCPTCRHRLPTDNAFYEQMQNARESQQQNNPNNNGVPPFHVFLNQLFGPQRPLPNNNNNNNSNQ